MRIKIPRLSLIVVVVLPALALIGLLLEFAVQAQAGSAPPS